jgi:MerR family mercuric resistance operon transcriptional regulator
MTERFTIGQLARRCGVRDSAIRFYERIGLLRPKGRTSGNYRYYGLDAVDRLRFIRAAQAAGFDLDDIRSMLVLPGSRTAPCAEVRETIDARLEAVRDQLRKLRHVERALLGFHDVCDKANPRDCCPVVERLSRPARKAKSPS